MDRGARDAGCQVLYGDTVTSIRAQMRAEAWTPRYGVVVRSVLRAPWSVRTWLRLGHLATGGAIGFVTIVVVTALGVLTIGFSVTAVLGLFALAALLNCNRAFTGWQRARFELFLGVRIAAAPAALLTGPWYRRLLADARANRRQLGYHLLAGVLGLGGFLLTTVLWTGSVLLATVLGYWWVLPARNVFGWQLHDSATLVVLTVLGLALFHTVPWLAAGLSAVDVRVARTLLEPSRSEVLSRRVEALTESRADVVDAADSERRRIERDLHDGTQQRLTSLAMNLGMARESMVDLPEQTREAIGRAHEDAKQALSELRAVVRGLHPPVLDDRGLDAALSGVAARSAVPVTLRVDVSRRPSKTIEAVAYFVVSEALTNVAKHARASHVDIAVRRVGDVLELVVADDGTGGAVTDGSGGTGLRGLRQRVASVDGSLRIDSPRGVGTTIRVELPCES